MIGFVLAIAGMFAVSDEESAPAEPPPTRDELAVKRAVEKVLTFVLEAETRVEAVRLDKEGKGLELKNLEIANPKGFGGKQAIVAERVRVEADTRSLFTREPLVHVVEAKGATVNLQTRLLEGSNLKQLLDSANRFSDKKLLKLLPQKEWRIEKGVLGETTVHIDSDFVSKDTATKKIGPIEMTFKSGDNKGVTADQAKVKFLGRLARELDIVEENTPIESIIDLFSK